MNAGASAASTTSADQLAPVDIVAVSGLLDDVVVAEIETAIDRSTTNGAQAIVLQVNSRPQCQLVPVARQSASTLQMHQHSLITLLLQ